MAKHATQKMTESSHIGGPSEAQISYWRFKDFHSRMPTLLIAIVAVFIALNTWTLTTFIEPLISLKKQVEYLSAENKKLEEENKTLQREVDNLKERVFRLEIEAHYSQGVHIRNQGNGPEDIQGNANSSPKRVADNGGLGPAIIIYEQSKTVANNP